jgi:T-complex protein 1 subunit beta
VLCEWWLFDSLLCETGFELVTIAQFCQIPTILADNAGYDSSDLVARLRAAHYENQNTYGLDMYNGDIADMKTLGVTESFKLKRQVLLSASEAAELILRVDDIIRAAPR